MATIKCLGSSSAGNCYILECNDEILIIELGISWKDILKGLNYDLTKVVGCVVSHQHHDHAMSIKNALKSGLDVFSCADVQSVHPQVKVALKRKKQSVGHYKIQPIPLTHIVECYGYLIEMPDGQKLVFCTDTSAIPYKFKGINHILVESNNDDDVIIDNLCDDKFSQSRSSDHMELNKTIDFLNQNYSSELQNIVLIHLSKGNIDAGKAKSRVADELGFSNVYIAETGLELELTKEEF